MGTALWPFFKESLAGDPGGDTADDPGRGGTLAIWRATLAWTADRRRTTDSKTRERAWRATLAGTAYDGLRTSQGKNSLAGHPHAETAQWRATLTGTADHPGGDGTLALAKELGVAKEDWRTTGGDGALAKSLAGDRQGCENANCTADMADDSGSGRRRLRRGRRCCCNHHSDAFLASHNSVCLRWCSTANWDKANTKPVLVLLRVVVGGFHATKTARPTTTPWVGRAVALPQTQKP